MTPLKTTLYLILIAGYLVGMFNVEGWSTWPAYFGFVFIVKVGYEDWRLGKDPRSGSRRG